MASLSLPLALYEDLSETERGALAQRAAELSSEAIAWFATGEQVLPEQNFRNIAEIMGAAAPKVAIQSLQWPVRFSMWMYLLDWYVDEAPDRTSDSIAAIHRRCESTLTGFHGYTLTGTFLYDSLAEILFHLQTLPSGHLIVPMLVEQVLRELAADRALDYLARQARERDQLPRPEAWFFSSTHGVNHMSCTLSLLAAIEAEERATHAAALAIPLWAAARTIRLANDVRTHAKDDREGLLHALRFLGRDEAVAEIDAGLAAMDRALATYLELGGSAAYARAIGRLTRIGVEVYGVTDIRYDERFA